MVLQIYHHYDSARRFLVVLTLPDKSRHRKVTKIEIAISMIFGNWSADLLHDSFNNTWRHNHAPLVVEHNVLVPIAAVWTSDMADGVGLARDVRHIPSTSNLTMLPSKSGHTLAKRLNHLPSAHEN